MKKTVKSSSPQKRKKGNSFLTIATIIVMIVWLLFPLVVTVIYSLFDNWTGIIPHGITLQNYIKLFTNSSFIKILYQTLIVSIVPIVITVIVMLLVMFTVTVYFPKLAGYVHIICMIPYAVQGIILSVSVLHLYSSAKGILGMRMVMLFGAYCIMVLPYIYNGIKNSMEAVDTITLIEAAEMLGVGKLRAFFEIVVPNMMGGIFISALLAVALLFGDYVVMRNLSSSTFSNAQVYLYQAMKRSSSEAAAVFVIIMALIFSVSIIVHSLEKKNNIKND